VYRGTHPPASRYGPLGLLNVKGERVSYNGRWYNKALGVMEQHLQRRDFMVANAFSVADIALYAYTHVAADGGFDLEQSPAVQAWCARVAAQPGHVPMLEGPPPAA
jgi:glutathione S-transferase